jgi:hypothetical protein
MNAGPEYRKFHFIVEHIVLKTPWTKGKKRWGITPAKPVDTRVRSFPAPFLINTHDSQHYLTLAQKASVGSVTQT